MKKFLVLAGAAALLSQCSHQTSSIAVDRYAELADLPAKTPRKFSIALELEDRSGRSEKAPAVTVRPGQEAVVAIEREFIYPVAYRPADVSRLNMPTARGSYPVTPSTPTDFRTRNLGYRAVLKARQQGAFVVIEGSISHEKFIGFTRAPGEGISPIMDASRRVVLTENRVELPNFVRSETPVYIVGLPGEAHVIDLPGVPGSATVTVTPLD